MRLIKSYNKFLLLEQSFNASEDTCVLTQSKNLMKAIKDGGNLIQIGGWIYSVESSGYIQPQKSQSNAKPEYDDLNYGDYINPKEVGNFVFIIKLKLSSDEKGNSDTQSLSGGTTEAILSFGGKDMDVVYFSTDKDVTPIDEIKAGTQTGKGKGSNVKSQFIRLMDKNDMQRDWKKEKPKPFIGKTDNQSPTDMVA